LWWTKKLGVAKKSKEELKRLWRGEGALASNSPLTSDIYTYDYDHYGTVLNNFNIKINQCYC